MDKLKRVHFKGGAVEGRQLIERLQQCIEGLDIAVFIHRNNFKYFPHFVEHLHLEFTRAALLYCIVKRFPELLEGPPVDTVGLSQQLKEEYTAINLRVLKKKDSFFYFLCIYFTKLTANFLEDTFVDILVEGHLEAELYISLVYVMIGLQVSPKSYEINHRKVVSEPLTFRTKTYLISKTDSI
jgi:acyl-ACP thioesterase